MSRTIKDAFRLPCVMPSLLCITTVCLVVVNNMGGINIVSSCVAPVVYVLCVMNSLTVLMIGFSGLPRAFKLVFGNTFAARTTINKFVKTNITATVHLNFTHSMCDGRTN